MNFECLCGHPRCRGTVSRSTRYRHNIARILRDHIAADVRENEAALPVEGAADFGVDMDEVQHTTAYTAPDTLGYPRIP